MSEARLTSQGKQLPIMRGADVPPPARTPHLESSANATVLVLPRSAKKVDRELLERAISHIRDTYSKTVSRAIDAIGRYLLKMFYDDDPQLYLSTSPHKHATLRLLLERCQALDFPVARTFLADALRLAAVSKQLPRDAMFHSLPPSHRIELLRLRALEDIERLARKSLDRKLSVRTLRDMVRSHARPRHIPAHTRASTPGVTLAIRAFSRVMRKHDTSTSTLHTEFEAMTPEQVEEIRSEYAALDPYINTLRGLIYRQ